MVGEWVVHLVVTPTRRVRPLPLLPLSYICTLMVVAVLQEVLSTPHKQDEVRATWRCGDVYFPPLPLPLPLFSYLLRRLVVDAPDYAVVSAAEGVLGRGVGEAARGDGGHVLRPIVRAALHLVERPSVRGVERTHGGVGRDAGRALGSGVIDVAGAFGRGGDEKEEEEKRGGALCHGGEEENVQVH